MRAALGRTFTSEDDVLGATAAILSYPFWHRAFGGDPDVLRQTIDLNGATFAIVGVMPEGFFDTNPRENPVLWQLCRVFGRLRPGVSDQQAAAELEPSLRTAAEIATAALATMMQRPAPTDYERPRVWILDAARGLGIVRDTMATPLRIPQAQCDDFFCERAGGSRARAWRHVGDRHRPPAVRPAGVDLLPSSDRSVLASAHRASSRRTRRTRASPGAASGRATSRRSGRA